MVKWFARCGSALAFLLLVRAAHAADYVWIEAETPTRSNVQTKPTAPPTPEFISGGHWLNYSVGEGDVEKTAPKDGALFEYDFTAKTAGTYEAWMRMGFVSQRKAFQWRIDQGDWQQQTGTEPYTDLMRLAFWEEVAWLKLGTTDLAAGEHTLQFREPVTYDKGKPRAVNFTADAFCLSLGAFHPNGKEKPDADWMTDTDKQAAAKVFTLEPPQQAGDRSVLSLAGAWQVTRDDEETVVDRTGPIATLPDDPACHWRGIIVPGDKNTVRPELSFCHRLFYRAHVQVPGEMAGQSFILRFPCNNMITTVFVNGIRCGFTSAPLANWDCDITKAVKPGKLNEIWVGIKDTYYARPDNQFFLPSEFWTAQWNTEHFDFPVAYHMEAGMLLTPEFIASGPAYASDVFAIPSVKEKMLKLEISLKNPSAQDQQVTVNNAIVPFAGGAAEKVFAPMTATVPAGQDVVIKPAENWANPKLWWPDDPRQYVAVTTVSINGKVVDTLKTKFGFREWEWSGPELKLNGIPWHGRADSDNPNPPELRKHGQNMVRLTGGPQQVTEEQLNDMDAAGMPVRWTGIFDGEGGAYGNFLGDMGHLCGHWQDQSLAWVKANRNHPSIFMWSIENEMTFINVRNWGYLKQWEPLCTRCAQALMALDPTRPLMVDGGRALMDKSLPIYGCHYEETDLRDYPDESYTLHTMLTRRGGWQPWPIDRNKPIFLGEATYVRGNLPAYYAGIGGEEAFAGRSEARRGAGLLLQMQSEGYRWNNINFEFSSLPSECDLQYQSWTDIALLCRQWDWSFGSGTTVPRTLRCFNDTHYANPITAAWQFVVNGKVAERGSKVCDVKPGMAEQFDITLSVPKVQGRTAGQFILTCTCSGKEVFRAVKPVAIFVQDGAPKPKLAAGDLLVLDPFGSVAVRLTSRHIPFVAVKSFADLPDHARVVIVGKDALTLRQATDPKWMTLAANNTRVIILDQQNPLQRMAIPADLDVMGGPIARSGPAAMPATALNGFVGRIAFSEDLKNPIFAGLDEPDFFTWGPDHILYRSPYLKATHGATSLVQCDEALSCTAMAQCPVNDGLLLLCQLVVGEKLASNPVAQRLFDNMLDYAVSYHPVRRRTAAVVPAESPEGRLLARSGLQYTTLASVGEAMNDAKYGVVVALATPANLAQLAAEQAKVQDFTARGGHLMLWGLTAEGLASFNKLVGVEHVIRPFDLEHVSLPAKRDTLLAGITMRDVVLESNKAIYSWQSLQYPASDAFTTVVDLDDIAPFCTVPGAKAGDAAGAMAAPGNWPRNMFSSLASEDGWMLDYYMSTKFPSITLTFPRPEVMTSFSIELNQDYGKPQQVNLTFDDDKQPLVLKTAAVNGRQDFEMSPRQVNKTLKIELAKWTPIDAVTTGINNVWIKVKRTADWYKAVKPLLNIGALVKYPRGEGAIVLNNLRILDQEANPINVQKKQAIVTTLLRNMGCVFSGGATVVAGAGMNYTPIELDTECNAFITKDKGWFDNRDLSDFPKGDVKLTGVHYSIRDFKTSPLPCAVMLSGPGAPNGAKPSVTAIPVARQADALFFLHTMKVTKDWQAPRDGDKTPPIVFKYVIHYADGSSVDVPIRYGDGIGHWVNNMPVGLANAAVAWAAPFEDKSGDQAVVYQYQWTNPKPRLQIASFDVSYDPSTNGGYGIPVLLAVTAATNIK